MRKSNKTNNRVNTAANSSKSVINNVKDAYDAFIKAKKDGDVEVFPMPMHKTVFVKAVNNAMYLRKAAIMIAGTNEGIWQKPKAGDKYLGSYIFSQSAWEHAKKVWVKDTGHEIATAINDAKKVDVEGATVEELKAYNAIQKSDHYPIHEDESFIYIVVDAEAADKPFKTLGFKKVGESNEDKTWVSTDVAKWNRIKASVAVPEPVKPTASDGKYATKSEFNALSKKVDDLTVDLEDCLALLKQLLGKTEVKGARRAQSRNSGKSTLRQVSK